MENKNAFRPGREKDGHRDSDLNISTAREDSKMEDTTPDCNIDLHGKSPRLYSPLSNDMSSDRLSPDEPHIGALIFERRKSLPGLPSHPFHTDWN